MRRTRIRKNKMNFQLLLLFGKVIIIWYLIVFSTSYLTADTSAYFTTASGANGKIAVGDLDTVDESSLAFIETNNSTIKSCEPITLKTVIKNTGKGDMQSESTYDVYYTEKGKPHREKLDLGTGEGTIKALISGETTQLTFNASEPGKYTFVAYQHDEHPEEETWSEKIKINCPPGQQTNTDENIEDEKETKKDGENQTAEDKKLDADNEASKEVDGSTEEEDQENQDEKESKENTEEKNDEDKTEAEENDANEKDEDVSNTMVEEGDED
ncbi:amyloid fiber anchoring/assembly protein TapA [Virgibacillus sp. CBA3643]|uniref:amyloid fiber anchoring/assembly protein TapA n=1 Tax=Virgibacillus sp. CBA3643 TaxID=2942278 RepID=UPI0035A365A0